MARMKLLETASKSEEAAMATSVEETSDENENRRICRSGNDDDDDDEDDVEDLFEDMSEYLPAVYNAFSSYDDVMNNNCTSKKPAGSKSDGEAIPTNEGHDCVSGRNTLTIGDHVSSAGKDNTDKGVTAGAVRSVGVDEAGGGGRGSDQEGGNGETTTNVKKRRGVMSSLLRMIKSLDMLEDEDGKAETDDAAGEEEELEEDRRRLAERLDEVVKKVDNWINHDGKMIELAYSRGVQSSESRLERLQQQLTRYKTRLFEVSRDRQVIMTYVRRHEQDWACRHERLRVEIMRLQQLLRECQTSPAQIEERGQMCDGEKRIGKDEMDKILSVVVEHQNRINELKLTIFAQQQHILSMESLLRDSEEKCRCTSTADEDDPIEIMTTALEISKTKETETEMITGCNDSTHAATATTKTTTTSSLATSPPLHKTTTDNYYTSKMSDVLLCDEGDYRLCNTNQPETATDDTMSKVRCLCEHGSPCRSSVHVQLVGQLPYLMDSPLDNEVAGVLACTKSQPYSLADLPYMRHSIQQQQLLLLEKYDIDDNIDTAADQLLFETANEQIFL